MAFARGNVLLVWLSNSSACGYAGLLIVKSSEVVTLQTAMWSAQVAKMTKTLNISLLFFFSSFWCLTSSPPGLDRPTSQEEMKVRCFLQISSKCLALHLVGSAPIQMMIKPCAGSKSVSTEIHNSIYTILGFRYCSRQYSYIIFSVGTGHRHNHIYLNDRFHKRKLSLVD